MNAISLKKELHALADSEIAEHSQRFFKTGKGEYGEGDKFLGIRVPDQRILAKKYKNMPLQEVVKLLSSPFHEERLTAVFILVYQFSKAQHEEKRAIFEFYLTNIKWINNWDLVDSSAPQIVGGWLIDKPRDILYDLAESSSIWERRIAILATFYFIKNEDYKESIEIADILLYDPHDLIHKAVGWMLREIGNRNEKMLLDYLMPRYQSMPRTMLRYAIEKYPNSTRQKFLDGSYKR